VNWLRHYWGRSYVGLVHRLDRNASGLMVVGKRTKAARRLTQALREGKVVRTYLVCLEGKLTSERTWCHWLWKDPKKNRMRVVSFRHPKAKKAVLSVKPVQYLSWRGRRMTLATFRLDTGRSHQIRVQAAREGYPVLGDFKYGDVKRGRMDRSYGRLALHAFRLAFPHPVSGGTLSFEDPLPEEMRLPERGPAG